MEEKPIAYEAYQKLASHYAAGIDTKPHNAYYDRPTMVGLWPDVNGLKVLDVGCGPGVYSQLLLERGAKVTAIDVSERMLEFARERLGDLVSLLQVNIEMPLVMFADCEFDFLNAPLCLDYVQDWRKLFQEFHRILARGGSVQFSCGHPAFDAEYYDTTSYFSVEQVECEWTGFGIPVVMPSYRRSLEEILMPPIEAGFSLKQIVEPLPNDDFRTADPIRYSQLLHRPAFLCVQAVKTTIAGNS